MSFWIQEVITKDSMGAKLDRFYQNLSNLFASRMSMIIL